MYAYTPIHMWMQMLAEPRGTELHLQAAAYQLGTDAGMEGTKVIWREVCALSSEPFLYLFYWFLNDFSSLTSCSSLDWIVFFLKIYSMDKTCISYPGSSPLVFSLGSLCLYSLSYEN